MSGVATIYAAGTVVSTNPGPAAPSQPWCSRTTVTSKASASAQLTCRESGSPMRAESRSVYPNILQCWAFARPSHLRHFR